MCGYFKPDMDDFAQQARGTTGPFSKPGIAIERKPLVLCFPLAVAEKNGRRRVALRSVTQKHAGSKHRGGASLGRFWGEKKKG